MNRVRKMSLSNHWYAIPLASILAVGLSLSSIWLKCRPTHEEKLLIFAASSNVDVSSIVRVGKDSAPNIREIKVNHAPAKSNEANNVFAYSYMSCDAYVVPESWLAKTVEAGVRFSQETIERLIPNASGLTIYQTEDETHSALKVYDKETGVGKMTSFFNFADEDEKEDYYLVLPMYSIHIKELNNSSSSAMLNVVNGLMAL